jgi:FtsP/CotA-like multicopper oxidase with cupredoxin domain
MSIISRRSLLQFGSAAVFIGTIRSFPRPASAAAAVDIRLIAAPGNAGLLGPSEIGTAVWAYDARVPGPEIRVRQGDRLRATVENHLKEETTVHWHGVRVPNAMDGVPNLTQPPIPPGGTFVYEFDLPDAGTFWYHPHQRSFEQVARGLYGAIVVEEHAPPSVDHDVTWVLGDWRLTRDGQISDDFGGFMDKSHNGRVGNHVTVNGALPSPLTLGRGERIRLRLINAASARIFSLSFEGHEPRIVALDGQPVEQHDPPNGRVVLGPAMRADLLIEGMGQPGGTYRITDDFYPRLAYTLTTIAYRKDGSARRKAASATALPPNPLPEPNLARAKRVEVLMEGGMMGKMPMGMADMMRHGRMWTINGVAADGHDMTPFVTIPRGQTVLFALKNDTAWHHPIHVHGHAFRVITRNGTPTRYREWRDTVLLAPRETADIAFVANNPGDWMLHCHILDHQEGGMMAVFRVS